MCAKIIKDLKTESKYPIFYQKSSFLLRFLQILKNNEYFYIVNCRYSYYHE